MKQIITRIIIVMLGFAAFMPAGSAAQSAKGVMELWDSREDGETVVSDTLMILINKNNSKRVRNIKNIRKDYGPDTKGIIFFLS
ncbi:MAG: hypothetical protein D3926_16130, partial [Desulfobacteraceae bacterium]